MGTDGAEVSLDVVATVVVGGSVIRLSVEGSNVEVETVEVVESFVWLPLALEPSLPTRRDPSADDVVVPDDAVVPDEAEPDVDAEVDDNVEPVVDTRVETVAVSLPGAEPQAVAMNINAKMAASNGKGDGFTTAPSSAPH